MKEKDNQRNMKKLLSALALIVILIHGGMPAVWGQDCSNTPDWLPSKLRFIGGWDSNGRPEYLDPNGDPADQDLINFVKVNLPEAVSLPERNDTFFGDDIVLNTVILDSTEVFVTFVHEEAFFQNVLGIYAYPVGSIPNTLQDLDSFLIVFPRINMKSAIMPGDKVFIGSYPPNTVVGYFLLQQGWVDGTVCAPSHIITTDPQLNTFSPVEYRQQSILMYYESMEKFLLSFEDIPRPGGDSDFNDVVFYISADPGAIDTTNIPKVVEATISGDTTLCDLNALANIRVDLKGIAPWKVTYNDGSRDIDISDITESPFFFQTTAKDTIRLVRVEDYKSIGIPRGYAVVRYAGLEASVRNVQVACGDEEFGSVQIGLTGLMPMDLRYLENGVEKAITGITDTLLTIPVPGSSTIRLLEISNEFCSTVLDIDIEVGRRDYPTAAIVNTEPVCEGEGGAIVRLNLTGEGPWTLIYALNGVRDTAVSNTAEMIVPLANGGTFSLVWLSDAFCSTTVDGSIDVLAYPKTSATILSNTDLCPGAEATVTVTLTGAAPWSLSYIYAGQPATVAVDESPFVLTVTEPGVFELVSVSDLNCDVEASGVAEVAIATPPTALLSGPGELCEGQSASLQLNLTGATPWLISYTDGLNTYEINASTNEASIEVYAEGTYSLLSVLDANCSGTVSGEVTLVTVPLPSATLSLSGDTPSVVCSEEDEVLLRLDLSGTGPWSVLISNGNTEFTVTADETPYEFAVSSPGTYRIISVTDAYCTGTGTGEVTVGDGTKDLLAEILTEDVLCFGETLEISVIVDGGASYTLTTDGTGFLAQTGETSFTYTPSTGEAGVITFFLEVSNECGSKTVSAEVMLVGELDTSFTYDPEKPLSGQSVQFTPNNTTYDSYFWDFGDGNTSTDVNPVHIYEIGGEYTVVLKVSLKICENEGEEGIAVETINQLYVPSAFNPSAVNPENQVVKVYGTNVSEDEFAFRIVNRWGKTMYETRSFIEANTMGWIGDNANTGELQDLSVFTWILRGKFNDGETFEKTGTVTKIK